MALPSSPVDVWMSHSYVFVVQLKNKLKNLCCVDLQQKRNTLGFNGEALYHHQLMANQTASGLCAYSGDIRVKDKVTVKVSQGPYQKGRPLEFLAKESAVESG